MKRSAIFSLALLLAIFISISCFAASVELKFTWNANSESDLAGYKIYRVNNGEYTFIKDIPLADLSNAAEPSITYTSDRFVEGREYVYSLTAYDTDGNESDYSETTSITIPNYQAPTAPTDFIITITVNVSG